MKMQKLGKTDCKAVDSENSGSDSTLRVVIAIRPDTLVSSYPGFNSTTRNKMLSKLRVPMHSYKGKPSWVVPASWAFSTATKDMIIAADRVYSRNKGMRPHASSSNSRDRGEIWLLSNNCCTTSTKLVQEGKNEFRISSKEIAMNTVRVLSGPSHHPNLI